MDRQVVDLLAVRIFIGVVTFNGKGDLHTNGVYSGMWGVTERPERYVWRLAIDWFFGHEHAQGGGGLRGELLCLAKMILSGSGCGG